MRKRRNLTRRRRTRSRKGFKKIIGGQMPLKVAILFVGRIKGYENVMANLDRIKKEYNPTVFCSLNKTNKTDYVKGFCEFMGITDDRLYLERTPPYPDYINNVNVTPALTGEWGGENAKQSAYSNFYHMQKVWKLFEKYRANFDIVLYYRADIETKEDLKLIYPLKDNTVYVPQNNHSPGYECDHGGLCMGFLYGNPTTMRYFFNMIDSIEDICKKQGVVYQAESLFKRHMENNNIVVERFPHVFTYTLSRHQSNPSANAD